MKEDEESVPQDLYVDMQVSGAGIQGILHYSFFLFLTGQGDFSSGLASNAEGRAFDIP